MVLDDRTDWARAEFSYQSCDADSVLLFLRTEGEDEPKIIPMQQSSGNDWSSILVLPPGLYRYKFIVVYDGSLAIHEQRPSLHLRSHNGVHPNVVRLPQPAN